MAFAPEMLPSAMLSWVVAITFGAASAACNIMSRSLATLARLPFEVRRSRSPLRAQSASAVSLKRRHQRREGNAKQVLESWLPPISLPSVEVDLQLTLRLLRCSLPRRGGR